MIALALVTLGPVPGVTILVVVTFTVSGLVLSVNVGALTVPPTETLSRALALASALVELQAARNTKGLQAADTIRKREGRTRKPLIVGTGIPTSISGTGIPTTISPQSEGLPPPTTPCARGSHAPVSYTHLTLPTI